MNLGIWSERLKNDVPSESGPKYYIRIDEDYNHIYLYICNRNGIQISAGYLMGLYKDTGRYYLNRYFNSTVAVECGISIDSDRMIIQGANR